MNLIISGKKPDNWANLKTKAGKMAEAMHMNEGFVELDVEFTEESLTKCVKTYAMALSHLKKGKRNRSSVKDGFNVIALDFDNEELDKYDLVTIDEIKERLNKLNISYFIYTTPRHSAERPKFRVFIPTKETFFNNPKTTIDIQEHDKIKKYFLSIFPECDNSVFQPERIFFGNSNAETYFYNSKPYLDLSTLPETQLISNFAQYKPSSENLTFDTTLKVKFANGEVYRLEDVTINEKMPIYCPFHNDNNPSAFINPDPTKYGKLFIYCSSCGKTWSEENQHSFNNVTLFRHAEIGEIFRSTPNGYQPFQNADHRDSVLKKAGLPHRDRDFRLNIPMLTPRFLPTHEEGYIGNDEFNIFELPKYLNRNLKKVDKTIADLKKEAPYAYRLLKNVFLNDDELLKFLKWNAYILQTGRKAQTSWIIQTENQRIGKNAICNLLLQPLYGENQYSAIQGKDIGQDFNPMDYGCWLRVYDEARIYNNRGVDEHQKEIIKNIITEKTVIINIKGVSQFKADNAMNFIFLSNNKDALIIDKTDKRFNIVMNDVSVELMHQSWWVDKNTFESEIASELPDFANYLMSMLVDEKADILQTINNEAKKAIQALTISQEEEFINELRAGNVDYFEVENALRTANYKPDYSTTYNDLIKEIETCISVNKALLQKFSSIILTYHFKHKKRNRLYGDLKKYGFEESTVTNSNPFGQTKIKVWRAL